MKQKYQFDVMIALRVIPKNDCNNLAALFVASKFISTHRDPLSYIELDERFISPFELLALITNQNEVGVTVCQLIVFPLCRVYSWICNLSLWADSNKIDI